MSQNRLNTDGWNGGVIDTPETTASESVSTECEALTLCRFERPETHTFETYSRLRNSVDRLVVDVVEVTETGVATIDLRYEMTARTITDTVTGSVADGDLWTTLGLSLAGGMFVSRPIRLMLRYYETHDEITIGEVWSPTAEVTKQLSQTEITGRTTHAGVECYTFRTVAETRRSETVTTGSLSPELQLVPQMVVTDSAGEVFFATTLIEYDQP
jgi:hypothetical protein